MIEPGSRSVDGWDRWRRGWGELDHSTGRESGFTLSVLHTCYPQMIYRCVSNDRDICTDCLHAAIETSTPKPGKLKDISSRHVPAGPIRCPKLQPGRDKYVSNLDIIYYHMRWLVSIYLYAGNRIFNILNMYSRSLILGGSSHCLWLQTHFRVVYIQTSFLWSTIAASVNYQYTIYPPWWSTN